MIQRDDTGRMLVACALAGRAESVLGQLLEAMRALDPSLTDDQVADIVFHTGLARCAAQFRLPFPSSLLEPP